MRLIKNLLCISAWLGSILLLGLSGWGRVLTIGTRCKKCGYIEFGSPQQITWWCLAYIPTQDLCYPQKEGRNTCLGRTGYLKVEYIIACNLDNWAPPEWYCGGRVYALLLWKGDAKTLVGPTLQPAPRPCIGPGLIRWVLWELNFISALNCRSAPNSRSWPSESLQYLSIYFGIT